MHYIERTLNKESTATSACVSFLEGIYQSTAETLPDIKDQSIITSLVDSTELLETDDAYRASLTLKDGPPNITTKQVINTKFVKKKGPRKYKSGLFVRRDRAEHQEIRYLPPGRMKDYYDMMLAGYPEGEKPASFATFYRELGLVKYTFLVCET